MTLTQRLRARGDTIVRPPFHLEEFEALERRGKRIRIGIALILLGALVGGIAWMAAPGPAPEEFFARGSAHLDTGDAQAAIVELRKGLQLRPTDAMARWRLAHALRAAGEADLALDEADRARRAGLPLDTRPFEVEILLERKSHAEVLERLAGHQDLTAQLRMMQGTAALALGQLDAAWAAYHAAVELAPDDAAARATLERVTTMLADTVGGAENAAP